MSLCERVLIIILCLVMVCPADLSALAADLPERETAAGAVRPDEVLDLRVAVPDPAAGIAEEEADSVLVDVRAPGYSPEYGLRRPFNPEPDKAVWMSALFPGLGQVYNRRYWKLPIIVAGYMGLGYATSWNNSQFPIIHRLMPILWMPILPPIAI